MPEGDNKIKIPNLVISDGPKRLDQWSEGDMNAILVAEKIVKALTPEVLRILREIPPIGHMETGTRERSEPISFEDLEGSVNDCRGFLRGIHAGTIVSIETQPGEEFSGTPAMRSFRNRTLGTILFGLDDRLRSIATALIPQTAEQDNQLLKLLLKAVADIAYPIHFFGNQSREFLEGSQLKLRKAQDILKKLPASSDISSSTLPGIEKPRAAMGDIINALLMIVENPKRP